MKPFAEAIELVELIERVFSDIEAHGKADSVYLFGQTVDNEESVFTTAAELFMSGKVGKVAFGEGGQLVTGEIYQTPDWRGKLLNRGVPENAIVTIQIKAKLAHTHTEALALVEYAKVQGWKTLYVTSPAMHQLRVFVNTISIVLHEYPELKVFNKVGMPLPWAQEIIHSQRIERGTRACLVRAEWNRILRYYEKGDLVSAKEILDYLNRRDK